MNEQEETGEGVRDEEGREGEKEGRGKGEEGDKAAREEMAAWGAMVEGEGRVGEDMATGEGAMEEAKGERAVAREAQEVMAEGEGREAREGATGAVEEGRAVAEGEARAVEEDGKTEEERREEKEVERSLGRRQGLGQSPRRARLAPAALGETGGWFPQHSTVWCTGSKGRAPAQHPGTRQPPFPPRTQSRHCRHQGRVWRRSI